MILAIDNDGVWCDFDGAIERWAEERHGQKPVPHDHWNFHDQWDKPALFRNILLEPEFWLTVEAHPEGIEGLRKLQAYGHDLVFITHRPDAARGATERLFSYWELWYPLVFADGPKYTPAKAYGCTWAVDDKPEEIRRYLAAGIDAYLFDRPWNQEAKDLPRVNDWDEILATLEGE